MSLDAPVLDDRTFQDLVDEAKRLIPNFCPEWTNHNLSDPGVALIELFAWMTEGTLYRLNRVPERYYAKFLELVGIRPFGSSAARTRLTFILSAAQSSVVTVPAGTMVSTTGTPQVTFATVDPLEIRPPVLEHILLAGPDPDPTYSDVADTVRFGRDEVEVFPGLVPGSCLLLGFDGSLAGNVLDLSITADTAGYGVRPDDPPIVWEAWNGVAWQGAGVRHDDTGGLNAAGTVSLLIGDDHDATALDRRPSHWVRARLLPNDMVRPWYNASPRIRTVSAAALGGTVVAEHSTTRNAEELGRSDGRPDQRYTVAHVPVLPRNDMERVEVIRRQGAEAGVETATETWTEVTGFADSGPFDLHYTWDSVTGEIRFGPTIRQSDGTWRAYGAAPADGALVRITGYRTGGGAAGNVGVGTLTKLVSSVPFVEGVANLVPARGGADAETTAEAKVRGPLTLRTGNRAVTPRDYERVAREASPEVARARALRPARPGDPVRLLIVPRVRTLAADAHIDDFALTEELEATLMEVLDERRTLGATLELRTPYYQGVSVAARVTRSDARPKNAVEDRVRDVLHTFLHPLVGGPHGTGWPFDADLNASAIAERLEAIDGVAKADEILLFDFDLRRGRAGEAQDVIRLDRESLFLSAGHQVVVE